MKIEYIFVKSQDDYCNSLELFKNFLSTNRRIEFKVTEDSKEHFYFDDIEIKYGLEFAEVEKSEEIIFHLALETIGSDEEQVKALEELDQIIKEINQKTGSLFSINTIWNDVTLYYGKKLYPNISEIENKLRKIIYLFMLKTVGSQWLDVGTPEKFQEDINEVIEKNNRKKSEINAEWLIYADFITLGKFFTAPYALKSNLKDLFKELTQYTIIDEETVLDSKEKNKKNQILTKQELDKLSDEYEPKNNWDRYFSNKLSVKSPNKFSKDWSSLYDIRNKVAHGKPISKNDYSKASELVAIYEKVFDECINIIDSLEITKEEAEAVEAVAQQIIPQETETLRIRNSDILSSNYGRIFQKIDSSPAREALLSASSAFASSITPVLAEIDTLKVADNASQILSGLKINTDFNYEGLQNAIKPLTESMITTSELSKLWKLGDITAELDRPVYIRPTDISTIVVKDKIFVQTKDLQPSEKIQIQSSKQEDK